MADKVKVQYQDDDYGIEVFVKKDTNKPEKAKPQPDTLDEDAIYEQRPKVMAKTEK
jgi:hypothetical protein